MVFLNTNENNLLISIRVGYIKTFFARRKYYNGFRLFIYFIQIRGKSNKNNLNSRSKSVYRVKLATAFYTNK